MTMDDPFFDIVSGLDVPAAEEVQGDILDVTKLSLSQLQDLIAECEDKLQARFEQLVPRTQEARDLHSLRNAAQVEFRKRTDGGPDGA